MGAYEVEQDGVKQGLTGTNRNKKGLTESNRI